jgi:hypothetical protein
VTKNITYATFKGLYAFGVYGYGYRFAQQSKPRGNPQSKTIGAESPATGAG